eukprot:gene26432-biopygen16444
MSRGYSRPESKLPIPRFTREWHIRKTNGKGHLKVSDVMGWEVTASGIWQEVE